MEEHLFKIHHKIYLKLNAICQEAGDMNVEQFLKVYEELGDAISKSKRLEDVVDDLQTRNQELEEKLEAIEVHYEYISRLKSDPDMEARYQDKIEKQHIRIKELEEQLVKDNVHTRSSSGKLSMVEEIRREQMQNKKDIKVPDAFKLIDGEEYWFEYCDDPEHDDYPNNGHWKSYDCPNNGRLYERISEKKYRIAYFAALKTNKLKL